MKLPKRNKISKNKKFNPKYNYIQGVSWKPNGLWYSYYNSWYNYLVNNNMTTYMHKYIHKIDINKNILTNINNKDKNKLLVIKTEKDFDSFHKKYATIAPKILSQTSSKIINDLIDWKKVAKDFGGIEIYPVLKNKRNYLWYATWDVASGCIWNMNQIINKTEIIYKRVKNEYKKV